MVEGREYQGPASCVQAFRDALQLQSSVGATAEAPTPRTSADVPAAASTAVQPRVVADAGCQVNTTGNGPETSQARRSSNGTAAAKEEEADRANQEAALAKAEAAQLKVCASHSALLAPSDS